jgi:rhodanese-related sulfurtransferase
MFKDTEYSSFLLFRSESLFYYIKVTSLLTTWLVFFPYTVHADTVTTDINQSPRLNVDLINPQTCNKNILTASHLSGHKKQHKTERKAPPIVQVKAGFDCLTTVENVYVDWNRKKNLLIDIRDVKAFNGNKIPGSMNLPLYMLKHKEALKKRNIVLIDKGLQLSTLEKNCLQLKAKGFENIFFMPDGLKAWVEVGYPMTGDKMTLQGLSDVTPFEFVSVINERDWLFIDLDHSSKELANLISPSGGVIEYTDDYASLQGKIDAFKAAIKPGVIPGFLVISQHGNSNRIIKKRFLDFAIKDVYYLKGGVSGLKRFMQKHAAQVERLRKGFQVRMGCNG